MEPMICACLGPSPGEQHCPCKMRQLGLKPKIDEPMNEEENKRFNETLGRVFGISNPNAEK